MEPIKTTRHPGRSLLQCAKDWVARETPSLRIVKCEPGYDADKAANFSAPAPATNSPATARGPLKWTVVSMPEFPAEK